MGTTKKLLILSVSAGAGHMRAAEAVKAHAADLATTLEVVHLDVMDLVPDTFRRIYADAYIKIIEEHPAIWGYLYQKSDKVPRSAAVSRLRRGIERMNTRKLRGVIELEAPDHILCTHFLPAELLAHEIVRGRCQVPVWVQVTDFDLHQLWVQQHMAGYFVANEEVAFRLVRRGIPAASVHVTGIPIMPAFATPLARDTCAAELGLTPGLPTFLMMSGGVGLAGMYNAVEQLMLVEGEFQVIALAGKNKTLLKQLQGLAERFPAKLFPQGFTTTIERIMAASDLAITKPGGLTTSECLAMGLPMIVVSPIPGQEEHNADYLLEQGVALKAYDAIGLEWRLRKLLPDPMTIAAMAQRMRAIGKPLAGRAVLDIMLGRKQ
jgi:processive 1,2-diacylglycerol beta-glucosyltransferase